MEQLLNQKVRILSRRLIADDRGWFLKAITGTEQDIPSHTGESNFILLAYTDKLYDPKDTIAYTIK
jgi:hypothetical protein